MALLSQPVATLVAVIVCPRCGTKNPEGARFCLNCGSPLASVSMGEERKVITVLFCDLVGFTERSDQADPEDVKAMLRVYHTLLKRTIEHFGGTVDKFIGDAVLGVFGAPDGPRGRPRARRSAPACRSSTTSRRRTASSRAWSSPSGSGSTPARP